MSVATKRNSGAIQAPRPLQDNLWITWGKGCGQNKLYIIYPHLINTLYMTVN